MKATFVGVGVRRHNSKPEALGSSTIRSKGRPLASKPVGILCFEVIVAFSSWRPKDPNAVSRCSTS